MNWRKGSQGLALLALALVLVAAVLLWRWPQQQPGERIAASPLPLPRASAEDELLLPEALEAARAEALRLGVRAFVVHRRGHRVFEHFSGGAGGDSLVHGGELARVLLALVLHQPEDAAADAARAAALVSERLWLPLHAGEAWLTGQGASASVKARIDDWMRVGDLLTGTGAYLGERVVSADAARMALAGRALSWIGDEPFLARDGAAFDLGEGVRLWLAPRRALTLLVWARGGAERDTLLPNILLRGLNDVSPAIGGDISDMVPGH